MYLVLQLTDCRVKEKSEKGLEVELLPTRHEAFLPKMHLSDSVGIQDLLYDTYRKGDVIRDAVYHSKTNFIVSLLCQIIVPCI